MKLNFVIGSDGKPISIFDLQDDAFKKTFGNAARHAIGTGDLIFNHGIDAGSVQALEFWHEPESWMTGAIKGLWVHSWAPYDENLQDSGTDLLNNAYAAQKAGRFKEFGSFARQMLNDAWISATKGSGVIGIPQGLN